MQKIADFLSLSPGNVTYHYPKKRDLMLALYDCFLSEIMIILPPEEVKKADILVGQERITNFYYLQQRFLFFYLDLLEIERTYPKIAEKHHDHIKNQIDNLRSNLESSHSSGILKDPFDKESFQYLAEQIWFSAVFWPRQVRVRGINDSLEAFQKTLWRQIIPYLTKKGELQFLSLETNRKLNVIS